jgi:hypothetical protein
MAIVWLDVLCPTPESRGNMNRTLCSTLLVAAAALAGCNQSDGNISANDAQANGANAAAPLELPPAIASSHAYRCKDNSLVYIDLLSDQKTAIFRAERNGPPTALTAPEAGQPYVAEGYALTATIGNKTINLTRPGKGAQVCNA